MESSLVPRPSLAFLAPHIQEGSGKIRVMVVQTTLQALFRSTITGVVVEGFRSSSVPVTHEGCLVESRRLLWFGSSQANRFV